MPAINQLIASILILMYVGSETSEMFMHGMCDVLHCYFCVLCAFVCLMIILISSRMDRIPFLSLAKKNTGVIIPF